jgi:2'-hydroxyisoflavone reductase
MPGPPDAPIQIIDVRDMGEWIVRLNEQKTPGVFNACGPAAPLTSQTLLDTTREATASDTTFTFVDAEWLTAQDADPHTINIFTPFDDIHWVEGWRVSNARAISAGLTFRPLAQTVRNTVAWSATRGPEYKMKIGATPAREKELLEAWHAR